MQRRCLSHRGEHKLNREVINVLEKDILACFDTGDIPVLSHTKCESKALSEFSRILKDDSPRQKYERRTHVFKRALHWGQLKLILNEIEFLTLVIQRKQEEKDERPITMVYAGAAPGHHMEYLQKLFPDVVFELYDPNDFVVEDNLTLRTHVQFFTDKDAAHWSEQPKEKYIVFCSDIRTDPATPENVKANMDMQLRWWQIISPELAIFKFRLPWEEGTTEYLDGDIYIQPYPGPTSTETRLIVKKGAGMKTYDNKKYEEQLFYHNIHCREVSYNMRLKLETDGIDGCYDCTCFMHIVKSYLYAVKKKQRIVIYCDL